MCAFALAAASCGGSESASGSIRLLVFGDPPEINAYRTMIRAFSEQEPDIDVQLVEASDRDDLIARLSTSLAGGSPPDLFLMNYRFYGQFAARDVLEPLEPYVEDSDAFALDDFYPQAVDAFRWNGEATCLPQNISSLVVYYNRDLFKRFDVPEPTDDMAWSQFVYRAQQLTRDDKGAVVRGADPDLPPQPNAAPAAIYGLGVEPTIIRFAPFVWSNRGELVDDDENPTRFTLDSAASKTRAAAVLRAANVARRRAAGRRGRGRGRRDALPQRSPGDAARVAPARSRAPRGRDVRLGRRRACRRCRTRRASSTRTRTA